MKTKIKSNMHVVEAKFIVGAKGSASLNDSLHALKSVIIGQALIETNGNIKHASENLGLNRTTLQMHILRDTELMKLRDEIVEKNGKRNNRGKLQKDW